MDRADPSTVTDIHSGFTHHGFSLMQHHGGVHSGMGRSLPSGSFLQYESPGAFRQIVRFCSVPAWIAQLPDAGMRRRRVIRRQLSDHVPGFSRRIGVDAEIKVIDLLSFAP